jgi:signal transduction histidine kinase
MKTFFRPFRLPVIAAAAVLAGTLLVAVMVAASILTERAREGVAWVEHTFEVNNLLAALSDAVKDAETGQRGFLLTGDTRYLEPYDDGRTRIAALLEQLARETADNPQQRARLPGLQSLIAEKLKLISTSVALVLQGNRDGALELVQTHRGKIVMDEIRSVIQDMRGEETRLLQERRSAAAGLSRRLYVTMVAATFGTLLLSGLAVFGAWRAIRELRMAHDTTLAEMSSRQRAETQLRQLQKLEAIGQLTGGIAHDFNNMLAVILAGLELARRRLLPGQPDVQKFIESAIDGAQRAAKLTTQLLAYSRQQPLMPEVISPNTVVGPISEMLRRTIPETIELQTVLGAGLWNTNVDPQQLQSSLLNVCLNARDAMPEGGRLTIETANAFIDERYAAEHDIAVGQYVQVAVSDTGHGMTPETMARAFDPFFTTKPVGKGTGLGLSQLQGFVRHSGGHVKIYSEPGTGTTIKIYLPRSQASSKIEAQALPVEIRAGGQRK